MNFKSRKCEENGKKVLRYSIRKHHLGVASVAVASVLFFATGVATVQADGPGAGEPVSGTPAPPSTPGSASTTSTLGTYGANTGDTEIENTNTNIDTNTAASTESNGNSLQGVPGAAEVRNGNDVPSTTLGSDRAVPTDIKPEDSDGARNNEEKPNYAGKVTLMKQWDVDADDPTIRKDTPREYKTGEDKLGSPAFHSSTANTFLGWSDKPSVDGKIDEANGARLFSPEDTVATAFPKGLKADSKLYGVYTSFTKNEAPVPADDEIARGRILLSGLNRFEINANSVKIDTKVESENVLPNTDLYEPRKNEGDKEKNPRRIIDVYKKDNNDTTKVNEVVLKAEFEMDKTTAMTVYRNPDARGNGPVLSNTYKNNEFVIDETRKTYTYVDLNVNLDKDLVVPEKLYAEFNGYSWRPLYAIGIKDGKKEILNVYSTSEKNLGNDKNSFNSLVSNTDPKVTFGVETKGYNNMTFRMILRSLNEKDSNRPESESDKRNERIAESAVKPDEGKSIAETIMRNMTLKTLSSRELKKLFPDKSEEEINQMVIRIKQEKAKTLADTNGETVLKVTGSVEGNVHPNAGKITKTFFGFPITVDLSRNLPIHNVAANVLELGYITFYNVTYKFQSGTPGKALPKEIENLKPADTATHLNGDQVTPSQPKIREYLDKVNNGKWVFKKYDAESRTVDKADVEFLGTWEFVHNPVKPFEPGKDPEHKPGKDPEHKPGKDPEHKPGKDPEHKPGKDPEHKPGKDPEHKPGKDPEHTPGNTPGRVPGSNSEPNPIPSENWNQGSTEVHKQNELPQTGSQQDEWLVALGGLSILGALTIFPKKREE